MLRWIKVGVDSCSFIGGRYYIQNAIRYPEVRRF